RFPFLLLCLCKHICSAPLPSLCTVHALWCYRCENEPSNWNCIKLVKCAETDSYCSTTVTTSRQGKDTDYRLSKGCAPTCTENNMVTSLGSMDYCNSGGPSSVKTSHALVAVATLASFAYILRTGL
uniref:Snake toxin/toxin-like domain-containing protein n=1 Tax=Varanus komodoensis TaxID=61221 RepID=A0A8D2LS62_VARKO